MDPSFRHLRVRSLAALAIAALLAAPPAAAQQAGALDEATQALFDAVLVNDLEAVKASVNDKADLEARDRWGMTPIDLAVDRGHFKVAHFLLSVRNFRRDQGTETNTAADPPAAPPPARIAEEPVGGGIGGTVGGAGPVIAPRSDPADARVAPPAPAVPRGVASREIAPPGAEPPARAAARPQWPAGEPNPFDPQVAAPGSSLTIVGPVVGPEPRPGRTAPRVRTPAPVTATTPVATRTAIPVAPPRAAVTQPPAEVAASPPVALVPAPEPVDTAAEEPGEPQPTADVAETESTPGFFGRMLGAIGLGGDGTGESATAPAAEAPAAKPPASQEPAAADVSEPVDSVGPPPGTTAPVGPPAHRVTVESTPIVRPGALAEAPRGATQRATVRQTQPRVTIRRTEALRPATPTEIAAAPEAPTPAPAAPRAEVAPPPSEPAPAPPVSERMPEPDAAMAPQPEEPGLLGRIGSLFSGGGAESPPAGEDDGPGFFGRLASIVPDFGGDDKGAGADDSATAPLAADTGVQAAAAAPTTPERTHAGYAPDSDEAAEDRPGLVRRALDYIGLGDDEADVRAREEARAAAAAAPEAPPPDKRGRQVARAHPVTEPKVDRVQAREPLRGIALALGETTGLGAPAPLADAGARRPPGCTTKRRDTLLFCVRTVDWPVEMEPHFRVATIMYQGPKAVVRYADGQAVRYHAIFPSESFDAVDAHFQRRFGAPTDEFNREVRPFASKTLSNPAHLWQSVVATPGGERTAILEVRRYDDVRGGFPDTKHGVVMLYWADAPPIFPRLSSMDLMMIQWSRTR